jgi:hypothetical protein
MVEDQVDMDKKSGMDRVVMVATVVNSLAMVREVMGKADMVKKDMVKVRVGMVVNKAVMARVDTVKNTNPKAKVDLKAMVIKVNRQASVLDGTSSMVELEKALER